MASQGANNTESSKEEQKADAAKDGGVAGSPQLIFLNYDIYRKSDGSNELRFINKIIAAGQLKANLQDSHPHGPETLRFVQLDKNSQPISSMDVSNPLTAIVEYADDMGQLSKKKIELDSAQLSIRMQLDPNTTQIAIKQINAANSEGPVLIITNVK